MPVKEVEFCGTDLAFLIPTEEGVEVEKPVHFLFLVNTCALLLCYVCT
jgi:hypothetical protein